MNKAFLEESLNTLNEQELKEADFRTARNKVFDFLENFYAEKVQDFLVNEGAQTMEVQAAVPEYNPDWCPDEYTDEVARIDQACIDEIIGALVKADMKSLFLYANRDSNESLKQIKEDVNRDLIHIRNIEWDTDGEEVESLPISVDIPVFEILDSNESLEDLSEDDLEERLANFLSDEFGFLVFGFSIL